MHSGCKEQGSATGKPRRERGEAHESVSLARERDVVVRKHALLDVPFELPLLLLRLLPSALLARVLGLDLFAFAVAGWAGHSLGLNVAEPNGSVDGDVALSARALKVSARMPRREARGLTSP